MYTCLALCARALAVDRRTPRSVADGQSLWRRAVERLPPLMEVSASGYSEKAHVVCLIDSLTFFVLDVNRKQR